MRGTWIPPSPAIIHTQCEGRNRYITLLGGQRKGFSHPFLQINMIKSVEKVRGYNTGMQQRVGAYGVLPPADNAELCSAHFVREYMFRHGSKGGSARSLSCAARGAVRRTRRSLARL